MRKTIIYDKRHPSGPFLSYFFALIMLASAFGAVSGIVVMFQGGEMIGIGFLLLFVCGGMTVLSFFIPRWIEDMVISRYEQNRKPKSKLISNKDKNDINCDHEKYWEGFEFREIKPSFDETMDYYNMINNLFGPLTISGNSKFYIVRNSERNINIRIIDFNRSPNSMQTSTLMSHLFMIYRNESTKEPNDYIVVKPYQGYPGLSSIEKRKYDHKNMLLECTDLGIVPGDVKTIGDLIRMIVDTFCIVSSKKKNEIKTTKPSGEEKSIVKKAQNHSEQEQPQTEITIKSVNYTNEDVLMLSEQFRQNPYHIYKYTVNYKNICMKVFKLEYQTSPIIGMILYLFLIPKKNEENNGNSIFYVAIESSHGESMICSWEFDENKNEISHHNYGSVKGTSYRPEDLVKLVCDRVGI